jgi:hypothetical protein
VVTRGVPEMVKTEMFLSLPCSGKKPIAAAIAGGRSTLHASGRKISPPLSRAPTIHGDLVMKDGDFRRWLQNIQALYILGQVRVAGMWAMARRFSCCLFGRRLSREGSRVNVPAFQL